MFTLAVEIGFSHPFLVTAAPTAAPVPIDREDFKKILGRTFGIPKQELDWNLPVVFHNGY